MKHNHIFYVHQNHSIYLSQNLPVIFVILICILIGIYLYAVVLSSYRYKTWPVSRTICWILGILFAAIPLLRSLTYFDHDFTSHMIDHVLFGMLSPLLIALAAPMTLTLRSLSIPLARRLSSLLKSGLFRFYTHPIVAFLLNIGGLWILYITGLYKQMNDSTLLTLIIHFHIFGAGYLSTISILYIEPRSHPFSFYYRAMVLLVSIASHDILSKYLYAHPPVGTTHQQAQIGSMIMYYGGDAVHIMIIFILCLQWFRSSRSRFMSNPKACS